MIKTFKSRALKVFWLEDRSGLLPAQYLRKIRWILQKVEYAQQVPDDFADTTWNIHLLKGELQGYWSVPVSGNYRIIFRFENGHAYDVDYLDYH